MLQVFLFLNLQFIGKCNSFPLELLQVWTLGSRSLLDIFIIWVDEIHLFSYNSNQLPLNFLFIGLFIHFFIIIDHYIFLWVLFFLVKIYHLGIPAESSVVEIDAQDGKNIFYLPKGTEFTAVMSPGNVRTISTFVGEIEFVHLSVDLPVCLSMCLSIYLPVYLYLSVWLLFRLSVYLSTFSHFTDLVIFFGAIIFSLPSPTSNSVPWHNFTKFPLCFTCSYRATCNRDNWKD